MGRKEEQAQNWKELARGKKINLLLYFFVTVSFLVPIVFLVFRFIGDDIPPTGVGGHSRADYALMIVQCLLGLIVIHIPSFLSKKFRFEIPLALYGMYIVFLYCAIFLGEVRSFYYLIPQWDTILHGFSSLMLGFFGFMAVTVLVRDEHTVMKLSPLFVAVFAFCFALTIGALWEIYEYAFDGLLGLNMQKFTDANGRVLSGHEALGDTMKDIIIDALGAFVAAVVGSIANRHDSRWMHVRLFDAPPGSPQNAAPTDAAAPVAAPAASPAKNTAAPCAAPAPEERDG